MSQANPKIAIAIPTHDSRIGVDTCCALVNEQSAAVNMGLSGFKVIFIRGSSLITQARNEAVKKFLETDCDRLVFVDSDVSWERGDLFQMALRKEEVVGGAYRYKRDEESYPVTWLTDDDNGINSDPKTGLVEVISLPGGFMAISRSVFDKLRKAHPERLYGRDGMEFFAYYHCPPGMGEDAQFCFDWREIGGKVWLDPMLKLTHTEATRRYVGKIGDWMMEETKKFMSEAAE